VLWLVITLLVAFVVVGALARLPGRSGSLSLQELRNLHDGSPGEVGRSPLDLRRPRDVAVVGMVLVVIAAVVVAAVVS
jgi:hypothetical protein